MGDTFDNIIGQKGFRKIGCLAYRLDLSLWWHPEAKIEVILLALGSKTLVKGNKSYYLKSISDQGESWVRDIGPLQDYLQGHFPELHISFSHFRNITKTLANTRMRRKLSLETPTVEIPGVEHIASLQRAETACSQDLSSMENLLKLDSGSSSLVQSYMKRQVGELRQQVQRLRAQATRAESRLSLFQNLQKEYEHKGSAACFVFSLSSNIQVATSSSEFNDTLDSIVKELVDANRYQVTQKLCGGRLNIHVKEANDPVIVWIEEWLGGALSPRQMAKLGPEFSNVRDIFEENLMVTPDEDIRIADSIKDDKKLLAARVMSTLLRRLDKPRHFGTELTDMPTAVMPIKLGRAMEGENITALPACIPLAKVNHCYISGSTRAGKSYLGRVAVEEIAEYGEVNILYLDPRNQAAGLLIPEDRQSILSQYPDFGMKVTSAKGFKFKYYAPALCEKLPSDLSRLGKGRRIVSFKWLDDYQRCTLFSQILDAVFKSYAGEESEEVQLVVFTDESQLYTKRRVPDEAKAAAARAEISLDRLVREGRKYGCCVFIISQTIKDFSYDSASIRQNTNTKMFMRNSDREVDYAADFIGDGRQIIHLSQGTAIIHNSEWGVIKAKVRPPRSKVWDFDAENTQKIVSGSAISSATISPDAQRLLELVKAHYRDKGEGINLSGAGESLSLSSKRKLQQLMHELERAGLVKSRKIRERGRPRIIEPILSGGTD